MRGPIGQPYLKRMSEVDQVAEAIRQKRTILLRAYRHWLRREELKDCFQQASLELTRRAIRPGGPFNDAAHVVNALEQKFLSRIHDRHRQLHGRDAIEAALSEALPLRDPADDCVDLPGRHPGTEEQVMVSMELSALMEAARQLTPDQRLVLACRIDLGMGCQEFCERFGWTDTKYRKVIERARCKLRVVTGQPPPG